MIVDEIFGVFAAVLVWVLGLFPDVGDVGWLSSGVAGAVATISGHLAGLGAWVPFGVFGDCVTFVLAVLGIALAIKVIRIVASFFLAGGGAAG